MGAAWNCRDFSGNEGRPGSRCHENQENIFPDFNYLDFLDPENADLGCYALCGGREEIMNGNTVAAMSRRSNPAGLFAIEGGRSRSLRSSSCSRLREDWAAKLQPCDAAEWDLVEEIVSCRGRLQRVRQMEIALLSRSTADSFADNKALQSLGAYEDRVRRQYERAVSEYAGLRRTNDPSDEPGAGARRLRLVA